MGTVDLLTDANATGAGNAVSVSSLCGDHAMQINLAYSVAPTAVTVALEGSLDGVNWAPLVTHVLLAGELTAKVALAFANMMPVVEVRANLTVLVGGVNPTVTVKYNIAG